MSKILANRFKAALNASIDPRQTGFLPSRLIADNILTTSLLPQVLISCQTTGAIIFIDISKAFDTVDRTFLLRCLATLGASDGMLHWVQILLSDTSTCTAINGVTSATCIWDAGVRQGCPLSPLLYLAVAQALASWLHSHAPLGIQVADIRLTSLHHADDTQIFLPDLSQDTLTTLLAALATYSAASGQAINPTKSAALIIGTPPPDPPSSLQGIPVATSVTSLGIPQTNPPPLPHHTHPRTTRRQNRATRPSSLTP